MADEFKKFRTALNGFHRGDVVAYVEESSKKMNAQAKSMQERLDKANVKISALEAEKAQLLEENAALAQQIELLSAPVEPAAPAETEPDWSAEEIAAYRRAEAAERLAMERASALSQQMTAVLSTASSRFQCAGSDAAARCTELTATLEQLQCALADIQNAYAEAAQQLAAMEPLSEHVDESTL